jgi:hypothetical protein
MIVAISSPFLFNQSFFLDALQRSRYETCPEGHVFIAIVGGSFFSFMV